MKYLRYIFDKGFSALTNQISVGRMVYGFCLGLLWGMGNVFNDWAEGKLWPKPGPFWHLKPEVLAAEDARFEALMPDDVPNEMIFSEDELREENEYYPEGETTEAMTEEEGEIEEEYMNEQQYLMEVDKCQVQIKDIIRKAKEDGKLPR